MIVTKEFAQNVTKNSLAELATQYANEIVNKLGHNNQVEIKPQEIIYDMKEAESFFLRKFEPSKSLGGAARVLYNRTKKRIREKTAFIGDGVAYVPISGLAKYESDLVSRIRGNGESLRVLSRIWKKIFWHKNDYLVLRGFGSEIAHLVGGKIYGEKAVVEPNGLGEGIDDLFRLNEISWDIQTLYDSKQTTEVDLTSIKAELIDKYIEDIRRELELYETMLFEGDTRVKQKMIEIGYCKKGYAEITLNLFKIEYIFTAHFEGIKLATEVYDSVGGDINRAYFKLDQLLSNPKVKNIYTALLELGLSENQISKYRDVVDKNIGERVSKITPNP